MREPNLARLRWDLQRREARANKAPSDLYESYWKQKLIEIIPPAVFEKHADIWLEIGAGSGDFFLGLAQKHPQKYLIAFERCRLRAKSLLLRAQRSQFPNLAAYRGNAIPVLVNAIPSESIERLYVLYPPPWRRNAQRRNRWYYHPVMRHMVRALRPGGLIVWASDQSFYIDEARYICESQYSLEVLSHGILEPNAYNDLPPNGGRTKFEQTFLATGQKCFELIVRKPTT